MPDLAETREMAGLLIALVGQTATQISQCAEECGLSVVQTSALLQIDGSMSMRELSARLGSHASTATGLVDRDHHARAHGGRHHGPPGARGPFR